MNTPPTPLETPTAAAALGRLSRAAFLARLAAGGFSAAAAVSGALGTEALAPGLDSHQWKGKKTSKAKRWSVVTIGNLSRNRYWGEPDAKGVRSAICTCTFVEGEHFRLLIDPSLSSREDMTRELDRRSGLKTEDITAVFITHAHTDHWCGLAHFPEAMWLAARDVAAALNKTGKLPKPIDAATDRLFDAVDILPTPGHTLNHHSLRFDCDGLSIAVAGDAVATLDFWRDRRGYFNCVDFELSAKSMDRLGALADLIVPGHDNFFLVAT